MECSAFGYDFGKGFSTILIKFCAGESNSHKLREEEMCSPFLEVHDIHLNTKEVVMDYRSNNNMLLLALQYKNTSF